MRILQVNQLDESGGAERVVRNLQASYCQAGHESWLAVGRKRTNASSVYSITHERAGGLWRRTWWGLHNHLQPWYPKSSVVRSICRTVHRVAEPVGWFDALRGFEDYHYPGTAKLLELPPLRPDILHAHNLHNHYFDLRALPLLSHQLPVVVTLHDAWMLSGHCAHSFGCERWKTGCGNCPDLSIYPAIRRDATAANWQRKRRIYAACRLYVATPSQWLMDKVQQSILAETMIDARVIPNGVDTSVFAPGDRNAARKALDLPRDADVLLFVANAICTNPWKDYRTVHAAIEHLRSELRSRPLVLVVLGGAAPTERMPGVTIRFDAPQHEPRDVARYYQAADLYVHAAREDTFPNTVIEALACGTPAVATAVGGIPEQIRNLSDENETHPTGILTTRSDAASLASAVDRLLLDPATRALLARNAVVDVRRRFTLARQVEAYLSWFSDLLVEPAVTHGSFTDRQTASVHPTPVQCTADRHAAVS